MARFSSCLLIVATLALVSVARAGDTVTVKTLTFSDISKRSGTWLFPPAQRYEKILMEYTLKCDPLTPHDRFDCGEWDYLTYIFVTDSSGSIDSTRLNTPYFSVRGKTPSSYTYATSTSIEPDRVRTLKSITATRASTTPQHPIVIGDGSFEIKEFASAIGVRLQFIWTAQELLAKGLKKGLISRLAFQTGSKPFNVEQLIIRMRQDSAARLDTLNADSKRGTEVYRKAVSMPAQTTTWLDLHTNFAWDGKSDIMLDFCAAPQTIGKLLGTADQHGRYVYNDILAPGVFSDGDYIQIPQRVTEKISDEVTVMFWAKGDSLRQPRATSVFEAWDQQGRRVLNAHLPWDNGRVYWDAGITPADGTSDRVEKDAPPTSWEGSWNHWAFVKNASTGMMRVYLNGSVFMESTGTAKSMAGISRFILGAGSAGSYPGQLMHIAILNRALDSIQVREVMTKGSSATGLPLTSLLAYYQVFSMGDQRLVGDASGNNNFAMKYGRPSVIMVATSDLPMPSKFLTGRPNIGFDQDSSALLDTAYEYIDNDMVPRYTEVYRNSRAINKRVYPSDSLAQLQVATDTLLTIDARSKIMVYDEAGSIVDSIARTSSENLTTITNGVHTFYSPIVDFEIGRYITPYGIGLDLGTNGFKWVFDVSDYAQLLHDNVTFSAGNGQELIDVTFKMIKGTPARDVEQLDQIYSVRDGSYSEILAGRLLTPEVVNIEPASVTHRLKTRTTGHRFGEPSNCSEFCRRNHQLFVDGTKRYEWMLWNECASNPVYPQGGTWVLDRAGWCPGAPVDVFDHELTPFALGKDSILVDYAVEGDQWNGSQGVWDVTTQFVGYSAPNHVLDASIDEVIAPTTWEFYHRVNPICGEPVVVLKNNGSTDLTTCTITYGAEGSQMQTYTWNGHLKFLERDTVTLPTPAWPTTAGQHTFVVSSSAPNTAEDAYTDNNQYTTQFVMPPLWYRDFEIVLHTNKQAAAQYSWTLRKVGGDTVESGSNLKDNTTYSHKYTLEDGCYEFQLNNIEGLGLDLWFVRADLGTGSLAFKSLENTIKTFNPDFGNTAWMQFSVGDKPTIVTNTDALQFNTPTLEQTTRQLRITPGNKVGLRLDSINVFNIKKQFKVESTSRPLPVNLAFGDTVVATVSFLRDVLGTSIGTMRIYSNDERLPTKTIRLQGEAGATSVDGELGDGFALAGPDIQVIPNPSEGTAMLMLDRAAHVRVFDAVGILLFDIQNNESGIQAIPLPSFASGTYTVVAESGKTHSTLHYIVVR